MLSAPMLCCKSAVKSPKLKSKTPPIHSNISAAWASWPGVDGLHVHGARLWAWLRSGTLQVPMARKFRVVQLKTETKSIEKNQNCPSLELIWYALCTWYASNWLRAGVSNDLPGRVLITCQVWDLKQTRTAPWLTEFTQVRSVIVLFGSMLLMVHGKCCAGYHVYASVWRGVWCAGDQSIQQEQLRLCRRIRRAVLPFAESPWQHTCEVWVSGLGSPQENWDVHGGWLHPNFPRFRRSLVNFGTQIWGVQSSNIGRKTSQTVVHTAKDNSRSNMINWPSLQVGICTAQCKSEGLANLEGNTPGDKEQHDKL